METGDTIGFIGLGNMGAPMAGRLLDAGHSLVVHDAREAAAGPLRARGARVGRDARGGGGGRPDRHHDPADLARGAAGADRAQGPARRAAARQLSCSR